MLHAVIRPYVGHVDISAAMAEKLQSKHGVTPDEVREVVRSHGARFRWHTDPERGLRLLVIGTTAGGRTLKVILQPVDVPDGTFRLRTAFAAR